MAMNSKSFIETAIRGGKEFRTSDVVRAAGVSRQFANKVIREYLSAGKLVQIGKTNRSRYIVSSTKLVLQSKLKETTFKRILANKNLQEDHILREIQYHSGILLGIPDNIRKITEYAFTEMVNNAIDHSQSKTIEITMKRLGDGIQFTVVDHGIGVFNNIMRTKKFGNEFEAIQELLKGKQTTMPEAHSGEGIFFTSKAADRFALKSNKQYLLFDNVLQDVFLTAKAALKGTRVEFWISLSSKRELSEIFKQYTNINFEFNKTEIHVDLHTINTEFISRSQAKRILMGVAQFEIVVLDFKNVETIGQGFADEVFRIWKNNNPDKKIEIRNAKENVQFMIDHATAR